MQPTEPLTDDQIRAHPAFKQLVRGRRIGQAWSYSMLAVVVGAAIWINRSNPPQYQLVIVAIPVAVANVSLHFYMFRHAAILRQISADLAVQRRARLLVWPWAETRYLRILP